MAADCILMSSGLCLGLRVPGSPEYVQLTLPCFSEGVIPGPPTDLSVTEATRSYVVLSWKPPGQRGHEGIMYFVEKVRPQHH